MGQISMKESNLNGSDLGGNRQSGVKTLTDPVPPRAARLGPGLVYVLDGQGEFARVPILGATEFGAAVGQHATDAQPVLVEDRDHPVLQQVGRGER